MHTSINRSTCALTGLEYRNIVFKRGPQEYLENTGLGDLKNYSRHVLWGSQVQWHLPVIPIPGMLRQEDHKFEASLDYIAKSYLKIKNQINVLKHMEL